MLRVVLVVALTGCRHGAALPPAINNTAMAQPAPTVVAQARLQLDHAHALARIGSYVDAYVAAQRGFNLLDGAPIDTGTSLDVEDVPDEDLMAMAGLRTRELERRLATR